MAWSLIQTLKAIALPHALTHGSAGTDSVSPAAIGAAPLGHAHPSPLVPFPPVNLDDAATIVVDATLGNVFNVTLGGNRILGNPTGAVNGQKLLFRIKQDVAGGRTLTYGTKYRFGSDLTSVVLSTVAGKLDRVGVEYDSVADRFDVIALMRGY